MPKMPMHTFKMDPVPWIRFVDKCASRGVSAAAILRAAVLLFNEDDDTNANALHQAAVTYGTLAEIGRPRADQKTPPDETE